MYHETEQSIVTRLQPLLAEDILVEPLPENAADYKKPYSKPRVNIMLLGEKYGAQKSTGLIVQETVVTWLFIIESKKLRGPGGIYQVVELIRKWLIGFRPANMQRMYGVELVFDNRDSDNGLFTYHLTMAGAAAAVQYDAGDLETEYAENVKKITIDEPAQPAVIVVTNQLQTQNNDSLTTEDEETLET
jgi:hypothetical protein